MSIKNHEETVVNNYTELADQEMNQVTGGAGSGSDCDYVGMSIQGNVLKVRAGYEVRAVHVYRNDSQIRFTSRMTAGQVLDIDLFGDAPMIFKVTGHACRDDVDFECSFIG